MTPYGTLVGLKEYAAARGVTLKSADDTVLGGALLRGSTSLDADFAVRWIGTPISYSQERAWPRSASWPDGTAISGVPVQVEYAAYEYAIQEDKSPGSTSPIVTPGTVKTRARVEGAVDVSYGAGGTGADLVASMVPVNTTVEGLLLYLAGYRIPVMGVLVV